MAQGKGIDWKNVNFVMGTHPDHLPDPLPQRVFIRKCENCGTDTYTETEYPHDVPIVCNVCVAQITAPMEQDSDTLLLYDLPNDVKARLTEIANQNGLPAEQVIKQFIEWKLGRPTNANINNKPEKKTEE
jgi:recombinational DNA repair protein (RecF pathway)